MRGITEGFVSWRRPRPGICFWVQLSAFVLVAGMGEHLHAADPKARTATMVAQINASQAPAVRLTSLARQHESGDGRQTLGAASTQRRASLLGAAAPWPAAATTSLAADRTDASAELATSVSTSTGRDSWEKAARFGSNAVAIRSSNLRSHRAQSEIPETLAANYEDRHAATRSVKLLRTDDLVRTGGVTSMGIEAPASSGVEAIGLLSNTSSLDLGSADVVPHSPWIDPTLGANSQLNLVR